jgi:hypothetical protein
LAIGPAQQRFGAVGWRFDRLPRRSTILPLPKTSKGTILAHYHRESGEYRSKP